MGAGLGGDPDAGRLSRGGPRRARPPTRDGRRGRANRSPGRTRSPGPSRPPRRTVAATSRGSAVTRHHAARCGHGRVEQHRVLAMDLEHAAALAHEPHGIEQRLVGQPEVEDHEALTSRPRHRSWPEARPRVVGCPETASDRPKSMALSAVRGGAPLGQPGPQRSLGRLRRPGSGIVERQERRRAAERRGHGILEEPVGLGIRRDSRVRVHIDHAGEDQHPGRLDHARRTRREPGQIRLDRRDDAAIDRDVGASRSGRGHDRTAADDEVRHRALAVDLGDPDRLGTLPETAPADLAQPVLPVVVRPRPRPTQSDWPPAAPPSTPSSSPRTGRRSRTR